MANVFTDANCQAVYDFDDSLADALAKQVNLTDNNTIAYSTTHKEGTKSLSLIKDNSEFVSTTDANLSTAFPCKGGQTNVIFSFCFWIRFTTITTNRGVFCKWIESSGLRSFSFHIDSANKLVCMLQYLAGGGNNQTKTFGTAFTTAHWYHVGISYNDTTKAIVVHIWDADATPPALLGADLSDTYTNNIYVGTGDFEIGKSEASGGYHDGLIDEFVVFNRVLLTTEMDAIRAGTFGAAAGVSIPVLEYTQNRKRR